MHVTPSHSGIRSKSWTGVAEIAIVFLVAWAVISVLGPLVGEGLIARQGVVWVANVAMLITIWYALRRRGQGLDHLGLGFGIPSAATFLRVMGLGLAVAALALVAFVLGAIVMTGLAGGEPRAADTSGYNYLSGNLPALLLALAGVYVVSSFGEELVYRGFLITRIAEMGGRSRTAWAIALVASSIAFGLAHFAWGATGMVQSGFMGLALGGAYLRFGRNLWVTVAAHAVLDTLLLVQQYLA